jgi:4-hydroxybenzoate polyprenyltransferase
MNTKRSTISNYFSLVKIHHTIFSLPFALIGFFLAVNEKNENINLRLLLLVVLCVLFARNAAMGFNRYVDREFDKKNPRTALRELPKEIIKPRSALIFVILNAILFIVTTGFLNLLCLLLAPVALFIVLGYSFTKRFTYLSHLFLGLGLALAPIGAYLAVIGQFAVLPVLYSFVVMLWVAGFDIIYALQDIDFDNSENLKSIPARIGIRQALILSTLFHFIAVLLIVLAGLIYPFHLFYWTGTAIFTILIIYQHMIIKPNDLSKVNMAFFTLNGIASIIYATFVIADMLMYGGIC